MRACGLSPHALLPMLMAELFGWAPMNLKIWQVDAFAKKVLEGNPAAIVPFDKFPDASLMQKIANENNLAETAYFVRKSPGHYHLRWFTPEAEVDLCGHATLASAWLLFEQLAPELKAVAFDTRSGTLSVQRGRDGRHAMSLPADPIAPCEAAGLAEEIPAALGTTPPAALFKGRYLVAVWDDAATVRGMEGPGEV